jgi:hypothetical protein
MEITFLQLSGFFFGAPAAPDPKSVFDGQQLVIISIRKLLQTSDTSLLDRPPLTVAGLS